MVPTKRKNHLGNLFELFFGRALDQMNPCPYFCQKCQFWAKFGHFWAKNPFLGGMKCNVWYPHIRELMIHLFRVENIDRCGSNWPLGTKMCNFYPKFGYLGPRVNFCMVIVIFVDRAYHQYAHGYNFPNQTNPKKILFLSYGSFFGALPCFWPYWAISQSLV